jgi:hypothetical protein
MLAVVRGKRLAADATTEKHVVSPFPQSFVVDTELLQYAATTVAPRPTFTTEHLHARASQPTHR